MEFDVPAQITYSSTHAQLTLLSVDDGAEEPPKGIATSVSTPAFISFRGPISTSITISVTDPHGATVDHRHAGGIVPDEDEDEAEFDDGYAPVPQLGYFSSCSSIDSLATLASHEDLASFASAATPAPAAITLLVPLPVPGPTADGVDDGMGVGVDDVLAPQQAQQVQRFLHFQAAQQARYAALFDDGADDDAFDFFGYGAHFRDDVEVEIEVEGRDEAGSVGMEDAAAAAEADGWAVHVPFLVPVVNGLAVDGHDHGAKEETKATTAEADAHADADADKENRDPLEVAHVGGVEPEDQVIELAVKDAKQLSTLDDILDFTSAFDSTASLNLNPDLNFTLHGELDLGFDFGAVLYEVISSTYSAPADATTITTIANAAPKRVPTLTPIAVSTPDFAFTRITADDSPYSSPSVYSTESAPYSPYPFATPPPGQHTEVEAPCALATTASTPVVTPGPGLGLGLASAPAGVFGAYDPACFNGLGFESMDLRLHADGSVQVVFDAGEDDTESDEAVAEAEIDGGDDVKVVEVAVVGDKERQMVDEKDEKQEKQEEEEEREERGADIGDESILFEILKRGERKHQIQVVRADEGGLYPDCEVRRKDARAGCQTVTEITEVEESFEKWCQACLALAAFAYIPVKAAITISANVDGHREGEERGKDEAILAGLTGSVQVFGVTTVMDSEASGAVDALEGKGIDLSGSQSALDDAANATTTLTSQPQIEPLVPCALRDSGVPATAMSSIATNEPEEEEVAIEVDEAREICPPADDIVSYIYSIPGPECMPSFAAVIAEHLSPALAPLITPASSFAIPAASTSDDCLLLSEPVPAAVQSSSFSSLHALPESQSQNVLGELSVSIDDFDHIPSLLAEESPFDSLMDTSIPSPSTSILSLAEIVAPDGVDGAALSASETEPATEVLPTEMESLVETEPLAADLSNGPLGTIFEEPEDDSDANANVDEECAELIKALAELGPDLDSDYDVDIGDSTSFSLIAPSPLLTVYEELAGGPQHLFNSLPRYARRSLDSLSSLGRRSSVDGRKEDGQAARGSEAAPSESSPTSSGAAPAAASEDGGWSLVASSQPESLSFQTPLRPLVGSAASVMATPSTPAMSKKNRPGFFMSRLSFCPSPSPKRTSAPSSSPPTRRPRPRSRSPTPASPARASMEKLPATARSGGRIRSVLRKLRTLF